MFTMRVKIYLSGDYLAFWCLGCNKAHSIPVAGTSKWTWNGNVASPTFHPSIKVTSGHYAPGFAGECWCTYNKEHPDDPAPFQCGCCHSFVKDGKIQFLSDCTHSLVGKTVEIPDWEEIR